MINISTATTKDLHSLCDLLLLLMQQEADFTPNTPAHLKGLRMVIEHPQMGCILKAEKDGQVIGMIGLLYSISTAIGAKTVTFEDFILSPEYRGKGYGQELFSAALKKAKEEQCHRVTLLTDKDNVSAQRFYNRNGLSTSAMIPFRSLL